MSGATIDLEEYLKQLSTDIEHFTEYWNNGGKEDPERYPKELSPGEWDEQLHAWQESNLRSKKKKEAQS